MDCLGFARICPTPTEQHQALVSALALRYRVYCQEFGYLDAQNYPDGLEFDEDDKTAGHFHAFAGPEPDGLAGMTREADGAAARASNEMLTGYVRLVRPDASGLLPVQRRCEVSTNLATAPDPSMVAEVSRLIIAPEFRRKRRTGHAVDSGATTEGRGSPTQPLATDILLQLFRQMFDYSRSHGIRYWFSAMERPLARSLAQMGFPFKAVGPEGEFYGRITPYMADLQDLQTRIVLNQPRLAQWFALQDDGAETGLDRMANQPNPVWARRPPPPQLWRADC